MINFKYPLKIINLLGVVLGLIASFISIWVYFRVDHLKQIIDTAMPWVLTIELQEPTIEAEVTGLVARVKGHIEFRTTPVETSAESQRVNLLMHQKKIALICLVRPISSPECFWHIQSSPIVYPDGSFEALVFLCEKGDDGVDSILHQIIALVVPEENLPKSVKQKELPFYLALSNIVLMKKKVTGAKKP